MGDSDRSDEPAAQAPRLRSVLATDCGSTTTKAILIEERDGEPRLVARGEAPTTVEAPVEDVTAGVRNAVREVEELVGRPLLDDAGGIARPRKGERGVDAYLSTSSAGGGLQMAVAGVVASMTGESAARAALGAGAIVMDLLATNDRRSAHEKIERIRRLRPDMVLLAGGTDGGTETHVVELAELIAAADPRPRLGRDFALPVIYAGNREAREAVAAALGERFDLRTVSNLRPVLEQEHLGPAREEIHELFLEHVMAQAPGYDRLMGWTDAPILPTPGAVGDMIQALAREQSCNVVGVDIGGATTDVFSVYRVEGEDGEAAPVFNRTVSANLGMSYSAGNVLAEAGMAGVLRWIPLPELQEEDLRDRIGNKMIRPTTIPETIDELVIEQALAREALRLAFLQHREFSVGLRGVQRSRTIGDAFEQVGSGESLVDPMALDWLIGSGGVLSHAPRRIQAARMLIDAFQPEGVTRLAVDSIFMMPQLGALARLDEAAAATVLQRDCLVPLGTCIAPRGRSKPGRICLTIALQGPKGGQKLELQVGELKHLPLGPDETAEAELRPARGFDVGAGPGRELHAILLGGEAGLLLDGRGRPVAFPEDDEQCRAAVLQWSQACDEYPVSPSNQEPGT